MKKWIKYFVFTCMMLICSLSKSYGQRYHYKYKEKGVLEKAQSITEYKFICKEWSNQDKKAFVTIDDAIQRCLNNEDWKYKGKSYTIVFRVKKAVVNKMVGDIEVYTERNLPFYLLPGIQTPYTTVSGSEIYVMQFEYSNLPTYAKEELKLTQDRLEKERLEKERLEQERLAKERLKQERLEQERLEQERLEQERLEKERLEKERLEKERLEKERLEKERLDKLFGNFDLESFVKETGKGLVGSTFGKGYWISDIFILDENTFFVKIKSDIDPTQKRNSTLSIYFSLSDDFCYGLSKQFQVPLDNGMSMKSVLNYFGINNLEVRIIGPTGSYSDASCTL